MIKFKNRSIARFNLCTYDYSQYLLILIRINEAVCPAKKLIKIAHFNSNFSEPADRRFECIVW